MQIIKAPRLTRSGPQRILFSQWRNGKCNVRLGVSQPKKSRAALTDGAGAAASYCICPLLAALTELSVKQITVFETLSLGANGVSLLKLDAVRDSSSRWNQVVSSRAIKHIKYMA